MKATFTTALVVTLMSSSVAMAQASYPSRPDQGDYRNQYGDQNGAPRYSRGDRLPDQYRQNLSVVSDWKQRGLKKPPKGYQWVANQRGDLFLASKSTGEVAQSAYRDERDQQWSQSYQRTYSYNDDVYYRECRNTKDPAGVLISALIGGLLGNAAGGGGNRAGTTVAGVILGGVVGAALTKDMDCDDRATPTRPTTTASTPTAPAVASNGAIPATTTGARSGSETTTTTHAASAAPTSPRSQRSRVEPRGLKAAPAANRTAPGQWSAETATGAFRRPCGLII